MSRRSIGWIVTGIAAMVLLVAPRARADALSCDLRDYKPARGLTAAVERDVLTVTWDGDQNQTIRLRLILSNGAPTIQDLAVRRGAGPWATVLANATPDFHIVSGVRRMDQEQLEPLHDLGVPITSSVIDKYKWEAFWDAPLMVPGTEDGGYRSARPPVDSVGGQPGLPRKADEIHSAGVKFETKSCSVKTNGARLEVSFPGVQLGMFAGHLDYTVYEGANLIRQEIVAKTDQDSVAYKYDAGLSGLAIQPASRLLWHDVAGTRQEYGFAAAVNDKPATVQAANRIVVAEGKGGSVAAFPPPHNFFWSREVDTNLGYDWYRRDGASSFSFGVKEGDAEQAPFVSGRGPTDYRENFALRSARPGTWQRMPIYLYVSADTGWPTLESALAYTRSDHFKPLTGYKVMATHFHSGLTKRLLESGSLNNVLPDFEVVKAAGIDIFAPIDGDGSNGIGVAVRGVGHIKNLELYYQVARLHSDKSFVVMPNEEIMSGEVRKLAKQLGGHSDLLISHPIYWVPERAAGQPLFDEDAAHGKVYHIGSPADLTEMAKQEDLLIYMPHPESKGSTGFPAAIKDKSWFLDDTYRGIGFRWGMGLDGSEQRLCEYRCLPVFDDMNNWVADLPTPPKYVQAISEIYEQGPGDDVYANNPVNYVKLDELPGPDNWKPIVDAMKRGDYFVTSGEVLIPNYSVQGSGSHRNIVADVEWTFPLEFVEVVWGDGQRTERQVISATDLPAFGHHRFSIPFDAAGKKWVRFAVWDSAGNGALVQPIKLTTSETASKQD